MFRYLISNASRQRHHCTFADIILISWRHKLDIMQTEKKPSTFGLLCAEKSKNGGDIDDESTGTALIFTHVTKNYLCMRYALTSGWTEFKVSLNELANFRILKLTPSQCWFHEGLQWGWCSCKASSLLFPPSLLENIYSERLIQIFTRDQS